MTYAIIIVLLMALVLGSTAIAGGTMLGLVIATGLAVIYTQFPHWLKSLVITFRLPLDFLISASVFFTMNSNTATGLVGAGTCGLLVTLMLHHAANIKKQTSTVRTDAQSLLRSLKRM